MTPFQPRSSRRLVRRCASFAAAALMTHALAVADTTVEFVEADPEAAARGVVGYVVADEGGGVVTTFVLDGGTNPIIENSQAFGCISMEATVNAVQLSLMFTVDHAAHFIQNGEVVAEIAPDGAGSWTHWGTETLIGNPAYEALQVATGDKNLRMLAQSACADMGYWDCVLKVLECEGYSSLCVIHTFLPGDESNPCAIPGSPECIEYLQSIEDGDDSNNPAGKGFNACISAKKCWREASEAGCVPW